MRWATELTKAHENAGEGFVDGMVLGASNALYMGFRRRFGADHEEAVTALDGRAAGRPENPGGEGG